jgi:putative transcriptional regulator
MSKDNRIEDADRDLAAELLAAAKEIKSVSGNVVPTSEIVAARVNLNMSQAQFSALLGVSVRTLQKWEQNERKPSAAAQKLITIALKRPEVLIELFAA